MKILSVEFRRLVSTGDYSNMTIGAVAEIGDEQPSQALEELEAWVNRQIGLRRDNEDLTETVAAKRYELERIERELVSARERVGKVTAWMEKWDIPLPRGWNDDDMPF